MKLLIETVTDVKYLTEEVNGKKQLYIEGIYLQSEQKNRNGRIYPKGIMQREVARYVKEWVDRNRAYGELGHPDTPQINLDRASHRIVSLKEEGNDWRGKAIILPEGAGKIVYGIIDTGGIVGVSSRGVGSWKMQNEAKMIQDDYHLSTAADIVADPSAPDAFTNSLFEQKEWVWNNGVVEEATVASIYADLKKAKKIQLEEQQLAAFQRFINSI